MFVISKIDVLAKYSKNNIHMIDIHEKQVYYEFERSSQDSNKVELFKMHLDADPDFLICATDEEMRQCIENSAQYKRQR